MKIEVLYKKGCSELLFPMGFQLHKNLFWRVIGEMYQGLSFRISGQFCQVSFGILPLCMGISKEERFNADCERYGLDSLLIDDNRWFFEYKHPETVSATICSIVNTVQTRLIPLFTATTECSSAYEALKDLFVPWFGEDWNVPFEKEYVYFGAERYFMLLKLGRLEEARVLKTAHLESFEEGHRRGYAFNVKMHGEENVNRINAARIAPLKEAIELTKHPDRVRNLIAENERKSRISFGLEKE